MDLSYNLAMRNEQGRFVKGSEPYNKKTGRSMRCSRCGKEKYVTPSQELHGYGKYCSLACKITPQYKKCSICGNDFRVKPSHFDKRKTCSRGCYSVIMRANKGFWLGKKREDMTGEGNPAWKGEDASYIAQHKWVRRVKGLPLKCTMENGTCKGNFEWANISHLYFRDVDDYMSLCKSHHARYDKK